MSKKTKTKTESKNRFTDIFASIFSSEPDIDGYENTALPTELKSTLKNLEKSEEEVGQAINIVNTKKSSGSSGISPKINPDTEKAMRKIHNEQIQKESKGRERE